MRLKKLLTLSLAAIMGLSLVACGGNSDESKGEKNITIMVNGTKKFIDNIGKNIERWTEQNKSVSNIKIINCYEITEFNYNITEILDEHDKILNTSGEREKQDVFEGYEKGKKII